MQIGCLTLLLARLHGRAFAVALRLWQRLRRDVAVGLQGVAQVTLQVVGNECNLGAMTMDLDDGNPNPPGSNVRLRHQHLAGRGEG